MDQSHQRRFYSEAADGSVGKQAGNSLSLVAVGPSGAGEERMRWGPEGADASAA